MQVFGKPNKVYMYVKQALPTHSKTFSSSQGRNEMEWALGRWANTEPLTTRNPRRDYLTLVEHELSVRLFHSSVSSVYKIIFHCSLLLE